MNEPTSRGTSGAGLMLRASRFAPDPNASNDRFGDIDATSGLIRAILISIRRAPTGEEHGNAQEVNAR